MKTFIRILAIYALISVCCLSYAAEVNIYGNGNAVGKFDWGKKIDAQIKNMPLSEAVAVLLKETGITYTVDPAVAALKVTANFKGVSLQRALQELGRVSNTSITLQSDSISVNDDSWVTGQHTKLIVKKQSGKSPSIVQKAVLTPARANNHKQDTAVIHTIPLVHLSPVGMIQKLGIPNWADIVTGRSSEWTKTSASLPHPLPKGITSISLRKGSKALLITGDDASVAEMKKIVLKADIENKNTRRVKMQFTRYQLGQRLPQSLKFSEPNQKVNRSPDCFLNSMITFANKLQLDALAAEMHDRGIEPVTTASICTFDSFPVKADIMGGWDAFSSVPASLIGVEVTPVVKPEDNSVTMIILLTYSYAEGDGGMTYTMSETIMCRMSSGESVVVLDQRDPQGTYGMTIISPSY